MKIKTYLFLTITFYISSIFLTPSVVYAKILNKDMVDKAVLAMGYSADFCPINFQGDYSNMSTFFQNKESFPCVGNNEEFRFGQVSLYLRQSSVDSPAKAMANVILFGEDIFRLDSIGFTYYPNPESGGTFTDEMHETIKGLELIDSTTLHRTHPSLPGGQETLQNSGISTHYGLDGKIDGIILLLSGKAYKLVSINTEVHDKVLVDYTKELSDSTANWKTYTDTQNFYSFRYPDTLFSIQKSAPRVRLLKGPTYHFEVEVIQSTDSVENWLKKEKNSGQLSDTAFESIQSTFQNYPAILLQSLPGALEVPMDIFIVKNNNTIYKIAFTKEGSNKTIVDQILSTFKFYDKDIQNNNWRTYDGPGLSFQYPNNWADPKVENVGTKQTLNFEGTMSIEAGTVFDKSLKRSLTYDEYVKHITPLEGSILSSSVVGGRTGVRFNEKDIDGNIVIKIVIPDGLDKNFIYTIAYYSHISTWNDAATMAGEVLDPILATFKFKN